MRLERRNKETPVANQLRREKKRHKIIYTREEVYGRKKKLQKVVQCAIKRNVVMSLNVQPPFLHCGRSMLVIILVYSQYDTSRLVSNTLTVIVDLSMSEREPTEFELVV